jgi:hypothetical protein
MYKNDFFDFVHRLYFNKIAFRKLGLPSSSDKKWEQKPYLKTEEDPAFETTQFYWNIDDGQSQKNNFFLQILEFPRLRIAVFLPSGVGHRPVVFVAVSTRNEWREQILFFADLYLWTPSANDGDESSLISCFHTEVAVECISSTSLYSVLNSLCASFQCTDWMRTAPCSTTVPNLSAGDNVFRTAFSRYNGFKTEKTGIRRMVHRYTKPVKCLGFPAHSGLQQTIWRLMSWQDLPNETSGGNKGSFVWPIICLEKQVSKEKAGHSTEAETSLNPCALVIELLVASRYRTGNMILYARQYSERLQPCLLKRKICSYIKKIA